MTTIKVIGKEKEIEGKLEKGKVMPFGNAAHIIAKKLDLGKSIYVVIPQKPTYFWILSKKDYNLFISQCKIDIENKTDKMQVHYVECLRSIEKNEFYIDELYKLVDIISTKDAKIATIKKLLLKKYSELKD